MRIATVEQSRRIDRLAQETYHLPGEVLMEAAGALAAREIEQAYWPEVRGGGIAVVCGPGNNGGDGLVVARQLHSMGVKNVAVFLIAPPAKRSDLFQVQLKRLQGLAVQVIDLEKTPLGSQPFAEFRLLIDAVFGIGLKSDVQGAARETLEAMNALKRPVIALDTPSGLDADRGVVCGTAIRAEMTLTFGLAKPGFFVNQGASHVGRLRVLPIGFPAELFKSEARTHLAFDERLAVRLLPKRHSDSNKTTYGHAMIFAGRPGLWGAGLLSSDSAYRVGAGYVTLASFEEPTPVLTESPEILTARIDDEKIWTNARWRVAAVGPGLGTGDETANLLRRLKERSEKGELDAVVVDADAITVAAKQNLYPFPKSWILTPHAGELSRVLGVDSKTIESDRYRYVLEGSKKAGCHVVLKGFRTVVCDGEKTVVILSGNEALAKAGTGDVLTGMITGLLAQKLSPLKAAACGAWLHGRIADEWVREGNGRGSLEASDLGKLLPPLLGRLARSRSL